MSQQPIIETITYPGEDIHTFIYDRDHHQNLIYTNKIGDCLFIYLFICSAIGGQTARLNGLKFGG